MDSVKLKQIYNQKAAKNKGGVNNYNFITNTLQPIGLKNYKKLKITIQIVRIYFRGLTLLVDINMKRLKKILKKLLS